MAIRSHTWHSEPHWGYKFQSLPGHTSFLKSCIPSLYGLHSARARTFGELQLMVETAVQHHPDLEHLPIPSTVVCPFTTFDARNVWVWDYSCIIGPAVNPSECSAHPSPASSHGMKSDHCRPDATQRLHQGRSTTPLSETRAPRCPDSQTVDSNLQL